MKDTAFMTDEELHKEKLLYDSYQNRLDKKMDEISSDRREMEDLVLNNSGDFASLLGVLVMEYDPDKSYELHCYLRMRVRGIAKDLIEDYLDSDED